MSDDGAPVIRAQTIYLQLHPCEPVGYEGKAGHEDAVIGVRLTIEEAVSVYRSLRRILRLRDAPGGQHPDVDIVYKSRE